MLELQKVEKVVCTGGFFIGLQIEGVNVVRLGHNVHEEEHLIVRVEGHVLHCHVVRSCQLLRLLRERPVVVAHPGNKQVPGKTMRLRGLLLLLCYSYSFWISHNGRF